jgi:hypothetical protein
MFAAFVSVRLGSSHYQISCVSSFFRPDHAEVLNKRSLSFLRALVDHAYQAQRASIARQTVLWMHCNPDADVCVTVFDFSKGNVTVSMELPAVLEETANHDVRRARQSAGRLQLHVANISEGHGRRCLMVPMRSSGGERYDAMRVLAAGFLPEEDVAENDPRVLEGVRALLELDVVDLH